MRLGFDNLFKSSAQQSGAGLPGHFQDRLVRGLRPKTPMESLYSSAARLAVRK
jgi:hypothetical protein